MTRWSSHMSGLVGIIILCFSSRINFDLGNLMFWVELMMTINLVYFVKSVLKLFRNDLNTMQSTVVYGNRNWTDNNILCWLRKICKKNEFLNLEFFRRSSSSFSKISVFNSFPFCTIIDFHWRTCTCNVLLF
jgi:hypothetical protein